MRKCRDNPHRPCPGASPSVRRGECLVQVQVHDVEPHVTGAHLAEKGVHVGPVIVEQPTASVDKLRDFLHVGLEKPEGVRIGHHDPGYSVIQQAFKGLHIYGPVFKGTNLDDRQPADSRACGVGAVGAVRHDHPGPAVIPAQTVVLPHDHEPREFAMRSGELVERELRHACQRGQCPGKIIVQLQGALDSPLRLERVQRGEPGQGCHLLVHLRVVLHGTAAERIETGIDPEIHLGEIGIVPYNIRFTDLREDGSILAAQPIGQSVRGSSPTVFGKGVPAAARRGKVENQFIVIFHISRR